MNFTLYDYAMSGNCYKIRLFASILDVEYERIAVEFYPAAEHKSYKMLQLSRAGTLPILKSGDMILSETSAMLFWMARKFDSFENWWPTKRGADLNALILQWMNFSSQLSKTVGRARLNALFQTPVDLDKAIEGARRALRQIESHLTEQSFDDKKFLVSDKPTIADIACFPYVALSPDVGANLGLEHDGYPAIQSWLYSIKSLDGFIPMPGIYPMHALKADETDFAGNRPATGKVG